MFLFRKRRLAWLAVGRSLLALGCIATVTLALVTYTPTLTLSINPFFKVGLSSINWSMTTSSGTRYLPNGTDLVSNPSDPPTTSFAFRTQTGGGWVKLGIAQAVSLTQFLSVKVFILSWNSTLWVNDTMFTDSTFLVPVMGGLDGTSTLSAAFIHVSAGGTLFYSIQINYALAGSPTGTPTEQFSYTPNLN